KAPSAPAFSAPFVSATPSAVEFDPVPAMTGTRLLTALITLSITSWCSLWSSVADSPVVPQGTMPFVPFLMWNSTKASRLCQSILPSLKGVTSATIEPANISFSPTDSAEKHSVHPSSACYVDVKPPAHETSFFLSLYFPTKERLPAIRGTAQGRHTDSECAPL